MIMTQISKVFQLLGIIWKCVLGTSHQQQNNYTVNQEKSLQLTDNQ